MKMKASTAVTAPKNVSSIVRTLKDTQRRFAQISAMLSLAVFQGANLNQAAHQVTAAKAIAAFQCHVQMHLRLFNMYAPSAWLTDASLCNDGRGMVQSIECFHHKASFGDAELRELNTRSSMQTRQLKMPSVI